MHDGDYRSPDKISLGDYILERWLPSKRTRVKHSTAAAYEREIIVRTLERHGGRKAAAAQELGLTRQGLSKKIERLGIE